MSKKVFFLICVGILLCSCSVDKSNSQSTSIFSYSSSYSSSSSTGRTSNSNSSSHDFISSSQSSETHSSSQTSSISEDPSIEDYLMFDLNADDSSYSVSCKDKTYSGEINVPSSFNGKPVTMVAPGGFTLSSARVIKLPNTITTINKSSFSNAKMVRMEIPSSVIQIKESAFVSCARLEIVTFLSGSLTQINESAFDHCTSLRKIVLPDGLKYVGEKAFLYCTSLEEIDFPDSLEFIGKECLSHCDLLKEMTIPFIGESADKSKANFLSYLFCNSPSGSNNSAVPTSFTTLHLSSKCTYIKDSVFQNTSIKDLSFYAQVIENRSSVFYLVFLFGKDNCTLEKVTVCGNLKIIPGGFFKGIKSLVEVCLPDTIEQIGNAAFRDCISLETINMPKQLKVIMPGAFYGSGNGELAIKLPAALEKIYSEALTGHFKYITMPKSVSYIDFCNINGTENIFYLGTESDWKNINIADRDRPSYHQDYVYFYSESMPSTGGNFWHYVSGEPTIW